MNVLTSRAKTHRLPCSLLYSTTPSLELKMLLKVTFIIRTMDVIRISKNFTKSNRSLYLQYARQGYY